MNIPIEDAVTVAYVDVVHALSEVHEAYELMQSRNYTDLWEPLDDILHDLGCALDMLKPHVRRADV